MRYFIKLNSSSEAIPQLDCLFEYSRPDDVSDIIYFGIIPIIPSMADTYLLRSSQLKEIWMVSSLCW